MVEAIALMLKAFSLAVLVLLGPPRKRLAAKPVGESTVGMRRVDRAASRERAGNA